MCYNSNCSCSKKCCDSSPLRYNGCDASTIGVTSGMVLDDAICAITEAISNFSMQQGPEGPQGTPGQNGSDATIFIENTLFVSKNGSDTTGERTNLSKPFLTIYEASQAAETGDIIITFPGDYDEGSNIFISSDINYYFYSGVNIYSSVTPIQDSSTAQNINVKGFANFISEAAIISLTNSASSINFEANDLSGVSGIVLAVNSVIDIKVRDIITTTGKGISIQDNTEGIIKFKSVSQTSSTSNSAISVSNHSGAAYRTFIIEGEYLTSNSTLAPIEFVNTQLTSRVQITVPFILHIGSSGGTIRLDNCLGSVNFNNCTMSSVNGYGVFVNNSRVFFRDCYLNSKITTVSTSNTPLYIKFKNCTISKQSTVLDSDLATLQHTSGEIIFEDSTCVNYGTPTSTGKVVSIIPTSGANIRFYNSKLLSESTSAYAIDAASMATIYALNLYSSNTLSSNVTNGLSGGSIIVDPLIKETFDFSF